MHLQRQLITDTAVHEHRYRSRDKKHQATFLTVQRHIWIAVTRTVGQPLIQVTATNSDVTPEAELLSQTVTIGTYPNNDKGWDEAVQHARNVMVVFRLHDRADTVTDHYITAARASLYQANQRAA